MVWRLGDKDYYYSDMNIKMIESIVVTTLYDDGEDLHIIEM